jgi:hypothetical protein
VVRYLRLLAPRALYFVTGPGLRDIRVTEASKRQFRAEAYNLFNHPNFNTAFTANFGSISSAQDSRQLQFALKLLF